MSDFKLSDKINDIDDNLNNTLDVKDVAEAVRKLKEDLLCQCVVWLANKEKEPFENWVNGRIDKIFGEFK